MSEANAVATIIVVLNKAWAQPVQVNYAASNGTALAGSDYAATAGSLTFAPGQTTQTIAVPIMPDTIDELDETVLLTLSNASNATLGLPNPSTLIILDDDLPPTIAFNRLNFSVPEDAGAAAITTSLSSASVFTITANYTTANITAVAGSDYLTKTGTLIFIPNQTERSFAVSIIDDTLNESNETVRLILGNPVNATLGSTNPATLTIVENDIPVVEFERPNYQVLEDAGPANITATLSTASSLTVTLNYASSNGSAIAGSDYLTATGALTFPPGQIITSFPVTILNDPLTNEFDETLQLTLNTPNNAILGATNPVTLTITDDDGQPTVGFVNTRYSASEGNDGGTGVVTTTIFVSLSVPSAVTVTVDYNTGNGTATAPDDYLATSGTLTIPPNQTGQSFEIIVINDSLDEAATETANLSLSNPVSATLGTSNAVLNIIDDDPLTPCTDSDLTENGEPEIGLPPDGLFYNIDCGDELIVDMGATPIRTSGSPAFDLVYYERGQTNPTGPTFIYMDWVIVQVAQSFNGPWYTVFYWGDNIVDSNTSLGQTPPYNNLPEADNRVVQTANPQLYGPAGLFNLITGIAIDIDARVPAGTYRYVRFHVPAGGDNDVVQVDAIQALP